MLCVIKSSIKKFPNLRRLSTPCTTKSLLSQRLLLLLSTNEFRKDFSWKTSTESSKIFQAAALSTRNWLRRKTHTATRSLTSLWHLLLPLRVAFCQLISLFLRMMSLIILVWLFSIWATACVTSTTTGQAQLKSPHHVSMHIRLLSSSRTSEPTRKRCFKSAPKKLSRRRTSVSGLLSL